MNGTAILRDLRFALTSLRRSPLFTVVAIVTLGLGIGANTSAFSILNAILLQPLPYPDAERLERIYRATAQNSRGNVSPADYLEVKAALNAYGEVAAYGVSDMSLSEPGKPADMALGLRISVNLFSTLGIQTELGRGFRADEEIDGNHHLVIVSHRYWQHRFGGDEHIVGRTIRIDGQPHEIVGVLPAALNDWRHLGPFDVYRPLGLTGKKGPTAAPHGCDSLGVARTPSRAPKATSSSPVWVAASQPTTRPRTRAARGARSRSTTPCHRRTARASSPC